MSKYSGKLAHRYARALFKATESDGQAALDFLSKELLSFATLWSENVELRNALLNPMFPKPERLNALKNLADQAHLPQHAKRFLQLTFERDRIVALPEIASAFLELVRKAANIVQVNISVAGEVSREEARQIEFDLKQHIPGTLEFSWSVDPSIIGGMIVSYSGTVLDGSLKSKLSKIEHQLLNA